MYSPKTIENVCSQSHPAYEQDINGEDAGAIETLETTADITLNSKIRFESLVSPSSTLEDIEAYHEVGGHSQKYQSSRNILEPLHQHQETSVYNRHSGSRDVTDGSGDSIEDTHIITDSSPRKTDAISNTARSSSVSSSIDLFARTSSKRDDIEDDIASSLMSDDLTIDGTEFTRSSCESASLSPVPKHITIKEAKVVYDLQCHLCQGNYKNPKVLPCLHSFCHSCLDDTIK